MPVVIDPCELYGPVFDYVGTTISYTRRCADAQSDRIIVHDLMTHSKLELQNEGGGPDRFAHFHADGRLLYSHVDVVSGTASLWSYNFYNPNGSSMPPTLFHNKTFSDDDSYAHKQNPEYTFFIGVDQGYNLYAYRATRDDSVKLSDGYPMLGTVVFQYDDQSERLGSI